MSLGQRALRMDEAWTRAENEMTHRGLELYIPNQLVTIN